LDHNLTIKYNGADLLLHHRTYNHISKALVLPPSTTVNNIDNINKGHLVGRDRLEGGGTTPPPSWRQLLLSSLLSTMAVAWGLTINLLHP
jgi:hypothetical protein